MGDDDEERFKIFAYGRLIRGEREQKKEAL